MDIVVKLALSALVSYLQKHPDQIEKLVEMGVQGVIEHLKVLSAER